MSLVYCILVLDFREPFKSENPHMIRKPFMLENVHVNLSVYLKKYLSQTHSL